MHRSGTPPLEDAGKYAMTAGVGVVRFQGAHICSMQHQTQCNSNTGLNLWMQLRRYRKCMVCFNGQFSKPHFGLAWLTTFEVTVKHGLPPNIVSAKGRHSTAAFQDCRIEAIWLGSRR